MEKLIVESSYKYPKIIFDPENNIFEISGHSVPENARITYEPVLKWINENLEEFNNKFELNLKIDYLNSSSIRMFITILRRLEEFYQSGKNISVNWFYEKDDDDIEEEGKLFSTFTKLPFKLIPYEDEDEITF